MDFLNTVDVPEQLFSLSEKITDKELLQYYSDRLREQYINFDNMGYDCFQEITDKEIRYRLSLEIIDDCSNYLNLSTEILRENADEIINYGYTVYRFLVVDFYNIFIPNFLNAYSISTIEEFDNLIRTQFSEYSDFKKIFVTIANAILELFLNLKKLVRNKVLENEKKYLQYVKNFEEYRKLILESDINFLNNFIRPLINKNIEDLIWRI